MFHRIFNKPCCHSATLTKDTHNGLTFFLPIDKTLYWLDLDEFGIQSRWKWHFVDKNDYSCLHHTFSSIFIGSLYLQMFFFFFEEMLNTADCSKNAWCSPSPRGIISNQCMSCLSAGWYGEIYFRSLEYSSFLPVSKNWLWSKWMM